MTAEVSRGGVLDDEVSELEARAAEIGARIAKSRTAKGDRQRQLEVSAGYLLDEARELMPAAEWRTWCARYICQPMAEIDRLLIPFPRKVALDPLAELMAQNEVSEADRFKASQQQRETQWQRMRAILGEYYCLSMGVLGGWIDDYDPEENVVWWKWFNNAAYQCQAPLDQWDTFIAAASPVVARCRDALWKLQREDRRIWRQHEATRRAQVRRADEAAGAFRVDLSKTGAENRQAFADPARWQTVKGKDSLRRHVMARGECWSILVYPHKDGEGWGIRLDPPHKSAIAGQFGPERYDSAASARLAVLPLIVALIKGVPHDGTRNHVSNPSGAAHSGRAKAGADRPDADDGRTVAPRRSAADPA